MIKPTVTNNIKLFLSAALLFIIAYLAQINLSVPAFILTLYFYFKARALKSARLLYLVFLFTVNICASYFIVAKGWPIFYLPLCVIPMLCTILFNNLELSLIVTLASSVVIASLVGNHFSLGILLLISGVLASILVLNVRRRISVIRAGFIIGLVQVITLFFIDRFWIGLPFRYLALMINSVLSSIVVLGILPVFEYLFSTVTNISLLELADFNHPLLQRMIMEAPGTYHHSLVVGNLSDAAARAVGSNALLARIGAYYHDIGKIEKAEYFSENQPQESKHDELAPNMSKLVIMNHVKEGVDLAKKHKLNPRLIDFIQQHHGNSLVYYFYRRALEGLEDDRQIQEEGFRYPGPKPNSKETAIVLLADSVEAATRAMRDATPAKIEEVVHKIINNKFIDGQLDECELALNDLEKISQVFIRILGGIYHNRVTYPESKNGEGNHKKPAKESPHQSEKGKISNS